MVSSIHSKVWSLILPSHLGRTAPQTILTLITVDNTCRRAVEKCPGVAHLIYYCG